MKHSLKRRERISFRSVFDAKATQSTKEKGIECFLFVLLLLSSSSSFRGGTCSVIAVVVSTQFDSCYKSTIGGGGDCYGEDEESRRKELHTEDSTFALILTTMKEREKKQTNKQKRRMVLVRYLFCTSRNRNRNIQICGPVFQSFYQHTNVREREKSPEKKKEGESMRGGRSVYCSMSVSPVVERREREYTTATAMLHSDHMRKKQ